MYSVEKHRTERDWRVFVEAISTHESRAEALEVANLMNIISSDNQAVYIVQLTSANTEEW